MSTPSTEPQASTYADTVMGMCHRHLIGIADNIAHLLDNDGADPRGQDRPLLEVLRDLTDGVIGRCTGSGRDCLARKP